MGAVIEEKDQFLDKPAVGHGEWCAVKPQYSSIRGYVIG